MKIWKGDLSWEIWPIVFLERNLVFFLKFVKTDPGNIKYIRHKIGRLNQYGLCHPKVCLWWCTVHNHLIVDLYNLHKHSFIKSFHKWFIFCSRSVFATVPKGEEMAKEAARAAWRGDQENTGFYFYPNIWGLRQIHIPQNAFSGSWGSPPLSQLRHPGQGLCHFLRTFNQCWLVHQVKESIAREAACRELERQGGEGEGRREREVEEGSRGEERQNLPPSPHSPPHSRPSPSLPQYSLSSQVGPSPPTTAFPKSLSPLSAYPSRCSPQAAAQLSYNIQQLEAGRALTSFPPSLPVPLPPTVPTSY